MDGVEQLLAESFDDDGRESANRWNEYRTDDTMREGDTRDRVGSRPEGSHRHALGAAEDRLLYGCI